MTAQDGLTAMSDAIHNAIKTKSREANGSFAKRVSASVEGGRSGLVQIAWQDHLPAEENHRCAAFALADKMRWAGRWIGAQTGIAENYVWVNVDSLLTFETVWLRKNIRERVR